MNYIKKLKNINIPFDHGRLALIVSIGALFFALSTVNPPCLSAQTTCAVGGDNVFSGNIILKGDTAHEGLLDMGDLTTDQTYTFPDSSGEIKLAGDSLPGEKVMATTVGGEETTTDVYPLSLTFSTPLKTDGAGLVTASDLDITSDIAPGASLEQIRVNASATALEYFVPAPSGGAYTLIDSGTIIANPGDDAEVFTCWYGNTLDSTKKYKLIFDGGTGFNPGATGYIPSFVPIDGDCTLAKNEWEGSSFYATAQTHMGTRANAIYETYGNKCYTIQGADNNYSVSLAGNIQGHIQFSAVDNGNDYGFWSEYKMSAVVVGDDGAIRTPGIQFVTGSCLVWEEDYTNSFSDITGFMHYFEGGSPAPITRKWSLYEIDY